MMSFESLSEALLADASDASSGIPGMFAPIVGSWVLDFSGRSLEGTEAQATGAMTMGAVLGGRALQDVWWMPDPDPSRPPLFHGTTVRFYDPAIDAWRSTWIEPVHGRAITFIGRRVDDDIVLESTNSDPALRWVFAHISAESFTWIGSQRRETESDWETYVLMQAHRPPAPAEGASGSGGGL